MDPQDHPTPSKLEDTDGAVWLDLFASIREFGGRGLWVTIGLVIIASIIEGFGLVMILPMASLAFAEQGEQSAFATRVSDALTAIGFHGSLAQLTALGVLFLAWMILRGMLLIYRDKRATLLTTGYVDGLRVQTFGSIAHGPWPVIRRLSKSDLISTMTKDISRISSAIQFLFTVLITLSLSATYLIVGFWISPAIGLMLLGLTAAAIFTGLIWSRRSGKLGQSLTGGNKRAMFATTNFFDGLKTAKAYNAEGVFIGDYDRVLGQLRALQVAFVTQQGRLRRTVEMLAAGAAIGLLLLGVAVLGITGAELLLLGAVIVRLAPNVLQTMAGLQTLAFAMPAFSTAQRQRRLIDAQTESHGSVPPMGSANGHLEPAAISLENIVVSVDEDGQTFDLLRIEDMTLPATGLVHLSGTSGSGKSTCAELLAGLYLPSRGTAKTDAVILTAATRPLWQKRVSFAPQEPFLFNGTIRENLCWPDLEPKDTQIWEALTIVGADDLVRSLPGELGLSIRDSGNRLSGGERQRLCLARALLRPSAVLIIDEGMSAVQDGLELDILGRLQRLAQDKLIICVSHSPAIEARADVVIDITQDGIATMREISRGKTA